MAELPHGLRGRDAELDRLMSVLRRAPEQGSAIVISGEPGVGKSSLIEELGHRARAAGMPTLTAAGVETEAHLPLSGLHQLLRPVLAGVSELPLPQRDALESAFGLVAGGAPDLFLIALASLSLLSDTASREPLLVVVEDAHWLDRATAEALAFVGRRLQSDPVVLLVVVREERDTPFGAAGLAQMRVERLPRAAAAQLLDDQHPGLNRHVRQRVLELSLGNPLALSELPRALAPEQLTGGRELPAELPLSSRLEHTFVTRVAELAPGCQTALLVAALNDTDLLGETLHAANLLSGDRVSRHTLGPARLSGLVELAGDRITFRHPLIRSAIRQAASDAERRAGYASLAEAVDGDPDRRAWHRAAAVGAPDEVVARELERAAGRAQQRGSLSAAIAALLRAAELSEDPVSRARRLLSAAEFGLDIGQTGLAGRLLRQIEGTPLQGRDEGRVILLRETVAPVVGGDPSTVATIAAVAQRMIDGGDADLGLRMLLAAAMSASWIDRDDSKRQLLAASERLGVDERDPRLLAIVAHAAPVEMARRVIELATSWPADPASEADSMHLLGLALGAVGAFVGAEDHLTVAAERMRDAGRLRPLAEVLHLRGYANYLLGRWDPAIADAEESTRIAEETAVPLTFEQFQYGFANTVSDEEAKQLYETYAVPASGTPIFQGATANLNPRTEAKADTKNPDRGPLLIISGEKDHVVPWAVANSAYKRQQHNSSTTEIVEMKGRSHGLTIDSGWREVCDTALAFVQRFAQS